VSQDVQKAAEFIQVAQVLEQSKQIAIPLSKYLVMQGQELLMSGVVTRNVPVPHVKQLTFFSAQVAHVYEQS
jgi:hypothetical protein